jgi:hypothetical protein
MSDCRRGFGLDTRFIDHFNTQLVITLSYSAIADLRTLKITATPKSFPARSIFTGRFLVTDSNNGYFCASGLKFCLNVGSQLRILARTKSSRYRLSSNLVSSRHRPHRKHRFPVVYVAAWTCLPSSGRLFLLIKNLPPSNGRSSVVCFAAVA